MATIAKQILYPKNDQILELIGLQDSETLAYLNAATITGTLKDSVGVEVTGLIDLAFSYVAESDGDYQAQIEGTTFNPTVGGGYILYVDGAQSGKDFHIEIPVTIKVRKG
jgi:hypothetical protein